MLFFKIHGKRTLTDSDSAGQGRKRDEEEGGTRRKEGRGERSGRSDEKWLGDASLTSGSYYLMCLSSFKTLNQDLNMITDET